MKENKRIKAWIGLEFHFGNLYGNKYMREMKGTHTISEFKNNLIKLVKSYRHAVNESIQIADNKYKNGLINRFDHQIKLLKSADDSDSLLQIMIEKQSELIFELLGGMPNRWNQEKVINSGPNFKLDYHRSIQYTQSVGQKSDYIFSLAYRNILPDEVPKIEILREIYWRECGNDSKKFLNWFKINHPIVYIDLF